MRRDRFGAAGVLLAALLAAGCTPGTSGEEDDGSRAPRPTIASPSPSAPPSTSQAPGGTASPTASAPTPATPARTLVEMTVTGGIAGVRNRLVVRDDGTYTTSSKAGPGGAGRMTPAELTKLRGALEKADFARLPSESHGSPVADGFTYRITYAGHTVTTDDTARVPALREVFAALPER
ncbi:hypothetical protein [Streptomyces sp. NBC_00829]|uniref:hypothetical protein n=1 Tax=Streptomyces sp. NBC_00829 TaxID=2903679 RepID=UPI003869A467|nr:hypothetical protein OG293_10675 [Streptomyces sp. NBC_00829]